MQKAFSGPRQAFHKPKSIFHKRSDPASVLEPVKGWIEGTVFNLQHFRGSMLDGLRDSVPVRRTTSVLRIKTSSVPWSNSPVKWNLSAFGHGSKR